MVIEKLTETVGFLKSRIKNKPRIGVILGSGLGHFVQHMQIEVALPFGDIPNFIPPTVEGHSGNLIFGKIEGIDLVVLQGRLHYYEGHSMETVVFPARVMALLGIEILVVTNSAGGYGDGMKAGDFMIIEDHINLMGNNPLMGPNIKELGPRFPDMTQAYDPELIETAERIFRSQKTFFHKGIYVGVTGPTYETPSEIKMFKAIGGKAVGMSTVPEVIAANHFGLRVAAISCITNLAAGVSEKKLTHDEVTETAKKVEQKFCAFLTEFVTKI
ncbi:purine-nucleoside phosphorylase [Pseudobdellovibrio exovorus]|uniref:Purine nucleoside phosphorylase n=1 Tax=Pseudobdellovibrio exovorus JSS TaxID=1184267 RepID=M4VU83_9BACT|nr:purine-nucleoside phosphorylase [Pseudobdellovibrio exovorus]AGH96774.1 purine nucleoside phosphorylase [Pseudobdellovibrio exovorus JSS]